MPREKFQTLTEQMYYILLCLREERCGMDIMDWVSACTDGRVRIGAGTLYNLLEQFCDAGMIVLTRIEGRRRSYRLTNQGVEALQKEYERLSCQAADFRRVMGEEETP